MTVRVNPVTGGSAVALTVGDVAAGDGLTYEAGAAVGTLSLTDDVVRGAPDANADAPVRLEGDQWVINWDYYVTRSDEANQFMGVPGGALNDESVTLAKFADGTPGRGLVYNTEGRPVAAEYTNGIKVNPSVDTPTTIEFDYVAKLPAAVSDPPVLADFDDGVNGRKRFLFVYA